MLIIMLLTERLTTSLNAVKACLMPMLAVFCVAAPYAAALAQDVPPAVPVSAVKTQSLPLPEPVYASPAGEQNYLKKVLKPVKPKGKGFHVLELFTTQACPFSPKADAMMEKYSALPHVIALSCHVDYFDVKQGSLSQPLCSSWQARYEASLKRASKYTPQMVINGRFDAAGYLPDKIAKAFKSAHEYPVEPLSVNFLALVGDEPPSYQVDLPERKEGRYHLWRIAYDQPHYLTVKEGTNAGKEMVYYNVVSQAEFLGSWDGHSKNMVIESGMPEGIKGFAFLVQDVKSGAIIMAGKNE